VRREILHDACLRCFQFEQRMAMLLLVPVLLELLVMPVGFGALVV
jgi:hypothetical protein